MLSGLREIRIVSIYCYHGNAMMYTPIGDKYKQMYDDLIRLGLEGKLKPPKCTPHTLSNYRDAVREAMKSFVGAKQLFVFDQ